MSDVPPKKCPFAILMGNATSVCPPNDPWVTAVLYEAWLEHVDPSEPLWHVPYFGQIVRPGTAEENFEERKHEHFLKAAREDKELGILAVIDRFGYDAIEWRIVSSDSGRRNAMQTLANTEEQQLIAAHGGVLRDMDVRLNQTLNLTTGGKGDAATYWAAIEARRQKFVNKFKAAMEAYVSEYKSTLVPQAFVNEDGYRLGQALTSFRQGSMRIGSPKRAEIEAWAEALPKWAWNGKETDEYRKMKGQERKERWDNASDAKKAEWAATASLAHLRPEVRTKHVQAGKAQWANASISQKKEWSANNSAAQLRPEVRAKKVKRGKEQAENESVEARDSRINKTKATMATDASKAKRSKLATDQRAVERRAELARARALAVPFEKSKKRRAEMRAASDDFNETRKNQLLYMVSEDGLTIRRVSKEGMMQKRDIVGPVVDSLLSSAFETESD